ncbi:hypothetical protein F3Y22_tig00111059pilonHSYRG00180 [Hibiscus syriacus]|uniref:Protein FAR1-RELATED SEQUENCE n=1 Tax=Hibiscus syriacus TaxID=106335 RepID=A0A6A2Z481_HIBSY|nr:hypothetical protein F3Y22_tig00111059pilonHSYRG00180 [Hibiscus syriacus]
MNMPCKFNVVSTLQLPLPIPHPVESTTENMLFNEPLLTSPSTPVGPLKLHNKIFSMDHTDADNVKPTDECHEVHNVDESDILVGKLFSSRDQAWYFYKVFAQEHGFSTRRGTTWLDMEGNVKTQEFCCSKEGFRESKVNTVDRQRAHTPITRTRCKARVIVTTTNTNDQWIISKSYQKHNHALKFEIVGLPCRHQLHVLKHLDYTYLPGSLIQSRWTKDAKASVPNFVDLNVPQEIMQMARFASIRATTSMLCYAASKTYASFKTVRDEMKRLTEEFENSFGLNDSVNRSSVLNNVRDPQRKQRKRKEVTKNKVEKKIRRCGFCNGEGHNKLTCPQVKLGLNTSTQSTSTDFFEDGMEWL